MSVIFHDYSVEAKTQLTNAVKAAMHEIGGEIRSQIIRFSRVGESNQHTYESYEYRVIEEDGGVTVVEGSNHENAIWEEFGTGEFALHGDGRKDIPWRYKDMKGDWHTTKGKTPNRPMYKAFNKVKGMIPQAIQAKLGGMS